MKATTTLVVSDLHLSNLEITNRRRPHWKAYKRREFYFDDDLVRLLNEYIDGPELTVVIGTEHSSPDMQHFSLVTSTYFDGQRTGSIGVIGPRRMRYSQTIAAVDRVSQAVSRVLLSQTNSSSHDN